MSEDDRKLVERLSREVDTGQRTIGGGNTSADGKGGTMWGCEPIFRLANPDGPAAAARITEISEQVEGKDAERDAALAEADRLRAFLSAGSLQMLESEQAFKRRALAAEAALAKAQGEVERLREGSKIAEAWLERWAQHVANCAGGNQCTCGLTRVRYDVSTALQETSDDQ